MEDRNSSLTTLPSLMSQQPSASAFSQASVFGKGLQGLRSLSRAYDEGTPTSSRGRNQSSTSATFSTGKQSLDSDESMSEPEAPQIPKEKKKRKQAHAAENTDKRTTTHSPSSSSSSKCGSNEVDTDYSSLPCLYGVTGFLVKTYQMVSEPGSDDIISWSADGKSFLIHDPESFAKTLLPKSFKHDKLSSFIRQLNYYGFAKVYCGSSNIWEFKHPGFQKGQPELLRTIVRKTRLADKKGKDDGGSSSLVQKLMQDVEHLTQKNEMLSKELTAAKDDCMMMKSVVFSMKARESELLQRLEYMAQFLIVAPAQSPMNSSFVSNINLSTHISSAAQSSTPNAAIPVASSPLQALLSASIDSLPVPAAKRVKVEIVSQHQQQQQQPTESQPEEAIEGSSQPPAESIAIPTATL
eukprot:GILK01008452.1.p1 GENE.GILK01008452.1~~GILK01008452.1.p1  ORF type:complete len:419 (-),score=55.97 GILK01008452.1:275-1504(-)